MGSPAAGSGRFRTSGGGGATHPVSPPGREAMAKPPFRIVDAARSLRCAPELPEIAAALARSHGRVFEVVEPPGSIAPYHAHAQQETVIVLEGAMRFNVEEELTLVQRGQMIIIRKEAIHAFASVGSGPARLLVALSGDRLPAGQGAEQEEDLSGSA